jgi:hypothetical protein
LVPHSACTIKRTWGNAPGPASFDGPSNSARFSGLSGTSNVEPSIAVSRNPRQKHPGILSDQETLNLSRLVDEAASCQATGVTGAARQAGVKVAVAVPGCAICPPKFAVCDQAIYEAFLLRIDGAVGKGKNIGSAVLSLDSETGPDLYLAIAGIGKREGLVPPVGSKENPQIFSNWPLPGQDNPRDQDSEFKILNYIANKLQGTPDVSGTLYLYTELPACHSCWDAFWRQFHQMFPKIDLYISEGNGASKLPFSS